MPTQDGKVDIASLPPLSMPFRKMPPDEQKQNIIDCQKITGTKHLGTLRNTLYSYMEKLEIDLLIIARN